MYCSQNCKNRGDKYRNEEHQDDTPKRNNKNNLRSFNKLSQKETEALYKTSQREILEQQLTTNNQQSTISLSSSSRRISFYHWQIKPLLLDYWLCLICRLSWFWFRCLCLWNDLIWFDLIWFDLQEITLRYVTLRSSRVCLGIVWSIDDEVYDIYRLWFL